MSDTTNNNFRRFGSYSEATGTITHPFATASSTVANVSKCTMSTAEPIRENSSIESVAQWFLNKSAMTNKKLQKLCYYAYAWFITFSNELEDCTRENEASIASISADDFQAWIHGPVCPRLYQKYKVYGWQEIPKSETKPKANEEIESFLQEVWDAYGKFTADELESMTHSEAPWILARKGVPMGDPCANVISKFDILEYYSKL